MFDVVASSTRGSVAVVTAAMAVAMCGCGEQAGDGTPKLRHDGIGPLQIGMTKAEAAATGWLSRPKFGCMLSKPYPVAYELVGAKAPKGITGFATIDRGRLASLMFRKGVTTTEGVTVGKTTVAEMVTTYRKAGFKVSAAYDAVFGVTFVDVAKGAAHLLTASASDKTIDGMGVPAIPLCE